MDVRMPMKEFPVRLDGRDHARYHIMTTEEALGLGLQAGPRAERELAQQLPIKAGVESETLGMVNTTCRCATARQTFWATWMAVSKLRFWWQEGQVERCLHE
jgi:hypothetical protein